MHGVLVMSQKAPADLPMIPLKRHCQLRIQRGGTFALEVAPGSSDLVYTSRGSGQLQKVPFMGGSGQPPYNLIPTGDRITGYYNLLGYFKY